MKYDEAQLTKIGATVSTEYVCPHCKNPLVFKTLDGGIKIWCPNPMSVCSSIGANEGGFGKKESEAFKILSDKLSFGLASRKEQ